VKQNNINYFAVGLFVITSLALLIATLVNLSGLSKQMDTYYVEYQNITSLNKGSIVSYGGYPIGYVENITPRRSTGQTFFRVQIAIQKDWAIPADSEAHITAPGLLADNQIDIIEGQKQINLTLGGTIKTGNSTGIMTAMENVSKEFSDLTQNSLRPLIVNVQSNVDSVANQISHAIPLITNNISNVLNNLNNTADKLSNILGEKNQNYISNTLADASQTSKNINNISQDFEKTNRALQQLLEGSESILSENKKDLRGAVINLQKTMETIEHSMDSIVYNLESSSRNFNEFSRQIRDNPSVLLSGSPPPDTAAAQ